MFGYIMIWCQTVSKWCQKMSKWCQMMSNDVKMMSNDIKIMSKHFKWCQNVFDKLICCKLHKLTERYDDEDDESDKHL